MDACIVLSRNMYIQCIVLCARLLLARCVSICMLNVRFDMPSSACMSSTQVVDDTRTRTVGYRYRRQIKCPHASGIPYEYRYRTYRSSP